MANHFGARVAISRFQRLKSHRRSHPGRCPGLLHFAPLALGIQVLTQTLRGRAKVIRRSATDGSRISVRNRSTFRICLTTRSPARRRLNWFFVRTLDDAFGALGPIVAQP